VWASCVSSALLGALTHRSGQRTLLIALLTCGIILLLD